MSLISAGSISLDSAFKQKLGKYLNKNRNYLKKCGETWRNVGWNRSAGRKILCTGLDLPTTFIWSHCMTKDIWLYFYRFRSLWQEKITRPLPINGVRSRVWTHRSGTHSPRDVSSTGRIVLRTFSRGHIGRAHIVIASQNTGWKFVFGGYVSSEELKVRNFWRKKSNYNPIPNQQT
jgi:hypothetical protein